LKTFSIAAAEPELLPFQDRRYAPILEWKKSSLETCGFTTKIGLGRPNRKANYSG
jgi:hypothetical protein